MRLRAFFFISSLASILVTQACGDDDNTVRPRLDGGTDGNVAVDAGDGGRGALACGATIPTTYASTGLDTNAKVEKDFREHFEELEDKMKATEGASTTTVTAAELKAIYNEGSPSLRSVSTTSAQATIDGYLDEYGAAIGKTWAPADADKDGGAATGGKYSLPGAPNTAFHFSAVGVDLREATEKTILGGALYNHVVGLVAAPITDATIDRLLVAFGASINLANRTDADAGTDKDELIAEYASKRDDKSSPTPGIYRKIKTALLTMKAAVAAGDKCKAELDAAVTTFLAEWEKATYATAIFYLNDAANKAVAASPNGPSILHSFGEALGFVQSFKGVPQGKRKISDTQIDALLVKIGATSPYKLITAFGERVLKLNDAVNDIAAIYGFSAGEIEAFKKSF
jgi:hypothetical protein